MSVQCLMNRPDCSGQPVCVAWQQAITNDKPVWHLNLAVCCLLQRYIIRLIFMVPVYAICSWCSLRWRDMAIYYDTLRDW
jgi:hypothetical protein